MNFEARAETKRAAWTLALAVGAVVLPFDRAAAIEGLEPAVCNGRVVMEVLSAKRTDKGSIALEAEYLNTSNFDMKIGTYYGGANGHDTYLVDNTGETWPMLPTYRGGGQHGKDKVFQPDVKTKVTYIFRMTSGGADATKVNFTNWIQMLSPSGTSLGGGFGGFCKLEVRNVPLTPL